MSTAVDGAKSEKREREEDAVALVEEVAAVVAKDDTPAPKRAKAAGTAAAETTAMDTSGDKEAAEAPDAKPTPVKTMTKEDALDGTLHMLEFYFSDSNFSWDRFMMSKAGKMGEGMIDVSILMTFNKLKLMAKKASLTEDEAKATIVDAAEASDNLRVSEDKTQVGRVKPMTEEGAKERMGRTIQTKGYKKDASMKIDDVEALFCEVGKSNYVKVCRAGGRKITSIFVEFETKEAAEAACAKSDEFMHDGEVISVRMAGGPKENHVEADANGKAAKEEAKPEEPAVPVYEPGKIIHVANIPEAGVSRESLKDAVRPHGSPLYVDFSFGAREAWIRMENASEATAAFEASKESGLALAEEIEDKGAVTVLEGDLEKAYYERMEKAKAAKFSRGNFNRRGRGRGRGGGRGKGGGGKRGGRGRGGD